ncbi:MAG: hypothetical protein HYX67_13715 [Candidatus Melainabacteria bacterium]|nr:hypothetical protein [Candidatus Melainabacteria bacterium]
MSERDFKLYMAEDVRAVVEQLPARQRSAFINDAVRHYSSKAQDLLAFGEWLRAGGTHLEMGNAIVEFYAERTSGKKVKSAKASNAKKFKPTVEPLAPINTRPDIPIGWISPKGFMWNGEEFVDT